MAGNIQLSSAGFSASPKQTGSSSACPLARRSFDFMSAWRNAKTPGVGHVASDETRVVVRKRKPSPDFIYEKTGENHQLAGSNPAALTNFTGQEPANGNGVFNSAKAVLISVIGRAPAL